MYKGWINKYKINFLNLSYVPRIPQPAPVESRPPAPLYPLWPGCCPPEAAPELGVNWLLLVQKSSGNQLNK